VPKPRPAYLTEPVPPPPTPVADRVTRWRLWPELEEWVRSEGEGYVVEATDSEDWVGAFSEGNRMRAFHTGERFTYRFDREGTFYLAVIMDDDPDGPEELITTLNGVQVGCAVADIAGGRALFSYSEPLRVKPGDGLTFTTGHEVGCYRVYRLLFARRPIVPPPPEFGRFAAQCDGNGGATLYWTTTTNVETGQVELGREGQSIRSEVSPYRGRNHRVEMAGLEPGATYAVRIHTSHDGHAAVSPRFELTASPVAAPPTKGLAVPFTVAEPTATGRGLWPCWQGVPLDQGAVRDVADLRVTTGEGAPVPAQARLQSRWPDGSVKWAAMSLLADTQVGEDRSYVLTAADRAGASAAGAAVLSRAGEGWRLDTPKLQLEIAGDGALTLAGRVCHLVLGDAALGKLTAGAPEEVSLTDNGPARARLEWRGGLERYGAASPWRYELAAQISPERAAVQFEAGIWFGDSTPVFSAVESVEFEVSTAGETTAVWDRGSAPLSDGEPVALRQLTESRASIGGASPATAERAPCALRLEGGDGSLTVGMPDFWRSWPSGLEADGDGLRIQVLPPLAADEYDDEREHPMFYHVFAWFDRGRYLVRAGQTIRGSWWVHLDASEEPAVLAEWYDEPLRAGFAPAYLCGTGAFGRPLFPAGAGEWAMYEAWFDRGFAALEADRVRNRSYGWMHLGDWWGERGKNYGNNEYDLAWCLAVQWLRAGNREVFRRALEMGRHYTSVDCCRDADPFPYTAINWKHSCNHLGAALDPEELERTEAGAAFLDSFGGEPAAAAMDPMGHLNVQGSWLSGVLADDRWVMASAKRTCDWVADRLTTTFDFNMEREGAWPVAAMASAYALTGDLYYLNAGRLMADRCIERQDEVSGAWTHQPLPTETGGVAVMGGKTFAAGALCTGLLRYLEVEPEARPEVRRMLVRYADWLMTEAWDQEVGGFYYITNSPIHVERGGQRNVSETGMNAETTLFAYEETGERKYLEFWQEMMRGYFERPLSGMGKDFSQQSYNAVWGLDRALKCGVREIEPLDEEMP